MLRPSKIVLIVFSQPAICLTQMGLAIIVFGLKTAIDLRGGRLESVLECGV